MIKQFLIFILWRYVILLDFSILCLDKILYSCIERERERERERKEWEWEGHAEVTSLIQPLTYYHQGKKNEVQRISKIVKVGISSICWERYYIWNGLCATSSLMSCHYFSLEIWTQRPFIWYINIFIYIWWIDSFPAEKRKWWKIFWS